MTEKYAMYLRKSRADMELEALGEGETLARHKKMLEALAAKHNIHPDQITIYKEVVSGENIAERPQMQKLLQDVYAKQYKGVLVVEVERLARGNTKDQGEVADAFQYSNTLIITPAKVYDPKNEFDQEYFEFGLFMSRREYKTISRRLAAGKDLSVREGNFIASTPPYGFNIEKRSKKDIVLVEKPEESEIVKMIFSLWVNERMTVGRIATRLSKMGVKTPQGKTVWSRSTVTDILKNPHYIGKIRWKHREMKKEYVDGKMVKTNRRGNSDSIQLYEGKHEGFIDEDTFEIAQSLFSQSAPVQICTEITNPLAGILHCASCGKAIKHNAFNSRSATSRYLHINTVECTKKSVTTQSVLDSVAEALKKCIEDFEVRKNNEDDQTRRKDHLALIERMEAELSKQEKKRARIFDEYEDGTYTKNEFIERKQRYDTAIEELKKQIQDAKKEVPLPVNYEEKIASFHQALDMLKDKNISAKEKNDFLKTIIEDIKYDVIDHGRNKGGTPVLNVITKI